MSQESCWECGQNFSRNEVLDIPVFKKGWTIKWCFNCVQKQLKFSDYALKKRETEKEAIHIYSQEENQEEFQKIWEELIECYKAQYGKYTDEAHNLVFELAQEVMYGEVI